MEFGLGGTEVLEGGPGDFLYVAPGAVHREINPSDEESQLSDPDAQGCLVPDALLARLKASA